jgi:2-keto-4-pentenoate hydratase/2-oxohepta-3-ene-1,7-dioic acid hydratase in catechol pathway
MDSKQLNSSSKPQDWALGMFSFANCAPFAAIVIGERAIALEALVPIASKLGLPLTGTGRLSDLLQDWARNLSALRAVFQHIVGSDMQWWQEKSVTLAQLRTHAPIDRPRQIFCAGANYRKHVIELIVDQPSPVMEGLSLEERRIQGTKIVDERGASGKPYFFTKVQSAIAGPFDSIPLEESIKQPDWELELAVVIGKYARHVSVEKALDYVAGYTIINDITSRDRVYRRDMKAIGTDWLAAKSAPGYLPTGPYLKPADFVSDPQQLQVTLRLNGDVMQDEGTDDMIFSVARLISELSGLVELWPGDLLATGSPSGNGTHYQRFLRAGDIVEGSITGLGTQRTECVLTQRD